MKYIHILRAMLPGDTVYFPNANPRQDRQLDAAIRRAGGKGRTANFIIVSTGPVLNAARIVSVTLEKRLKQKGKN